MPKQPVLSGRQVVRALVSLGFEVERQRGSYVIMRRSSRVCVVPQHRELKRNTLGGVVEQAGVSLDELIAAL